MPSLQPARRLSHDTLGIQVNAAEFGFSTTDELDPLQEIVGQPRAMRALDLGLAIRHPGYNIFVAGAGGMGKKGMISRALSERVGKEETPADWIYVNNFDEPDRPLAISLRAGMGIGLKHDMEELVRQLQEDLPKALEHEDVSQKKQALKRQLQEQTQQMSEQVEAKAKERGLLIQQLPTGQIAILPLKGDRPMKSEEIDQLSQEDRADLEKRQQELAEELTRVTARQREVGRNLREQARQADRQFAARLIVPLVQDLARRYDQPKLGDWFAKLQEHMVNQWEQFASPPDEQQAQMQAMFGTSAMPPNHRFREYQVNLLVDNSNVEGAPVIIEDAPNYKNLFGLIDRKVDRLGRETTDFTSIKAGSLLRANGGYVIFNISDALIEPVVWKELKRTIKRRSLQVEAYEPFGMFSTSALKPEPIPLDVKLAVVGDPLIYHLLHLWDEDFKEIFKVKAEFDPEMDRPPEAGVTVGRLLKKLKEQEGEEFLPFDPEGVAELLRVGARIAGDRRKLTTEFSRLTDVAREASFWATREGKETVTSVHVRRAADERVYRSDLVASKIRDLIAEGTLRISLDGSVVGHVNGLVYANLGDYAFGRPARVTASVGVGSGGLVNIERESKLSGSSYDKGVLILEGYLRNQYARGRPLALSASLAIEQSYGMIDGDSASAVELLCLLSALAEVPLRQDIAVTGSINQWGEIQAVGGVNEKIEGFFDVCRQGELTGRQGVLMPAPNEPHLVLRPDVVQAIRDQRFHVWTFQHIDQAIELLSGIAPGSVEQGETFHGRVDGKLAGLARRLKEQGAVPERAQFPAPGEGPARDPRPPLPGRE